jgi:sugar O-acyltransferase (sialic acid O-acetyltransferase NeuD family)
MDREDLHRPKQIVILGSGGHAHVIADAIMSRASQSAELELVGFLDDDCGDVDKRIMGKPVIGPTNLLEQVPHDAVVIGIDDNHVRRRMFRELTEKGEHFITVIHPRATIARDATVGVGTVVFAEAVVDPGTVIGDDVILNTGCRVGHDCDVKSHSHVSSAACLEAAVRVEEGGLIGFRSSIAQNRTIGEWSVVGGGTTITHDVPAYTMVVGVLTEVVQRHAGPVNQSVSSNGKRQRVVIYGAGGLGREILVATRSAAYESVLEVVCFADDNAELKSKAIDGIPVVTPEVAIREFHGCKCICAIAEPTARQQAVEKGRSLGMEFKAFIHETAIVPPSTRLGDGCIIGANCILTSNVSLGDFSILNLQATMGHDVTVGRYATVGPGVKVGGFVCMGDRTFIGMGAMVINGTEANPIVIGEDVHIGAGSCVLHSIRPAQRVFGSPARPVPIRSTLEDQSQQQEKPTL